MKKSPLALLALLAAAPAHAGLLTYSAALDGPSEFPPVPSPGTGDGRIDIDLASGSIRVRAQWQGLVGNTTVCHTHGPTTQPLTGLGSVASQTPTYPGFPAGVTSGTYDNTFDLDETSTYSSGFLTANGGNAAGARAAFLQGLADGRMYLNIHSTSFGSGEIRGFWRRLCTADLTTGAIGGQPGFGVPNGVLDNEDFFYYLSQFAAGNAVVADVTAGAVAGQAGFGIPNGVINNDDFFYYLGLFADGCP
jgi:hypothetical protein